MLCYRERPKFQLKEDGESPRNGPIALGEASGTVKVIRDSKGEGTVRARCVESLSFLCYSCYLVDCWLTGSHIYSTQGKTWKNAGWDFSIGGSSSAGSGTVRSVVRPPQVRDRKPDGIPRKAPDGGNRWASATGSDLYDEVGKDAGDRYVDENQEYHHEDVKSLSLSGVSCTQCEMISCPKL